jgi:hypothetical protein
MNELLASHDIVSKSSFKNETQSPVEGCPEPQLDFPGSKPIGHLYKLSSFLSSAVRRGNLESKNLIT